MAHHTPGPWATHPDFPHYVVPAAHTMRRIGGHVDPARDLATYAQDICALEDKPRHRSAAEVLANAQLIAAAPDMLEALKQLRAAWESIPEDQIVPDEMNDVGLWASVDAAIDRAEGRL